VGRGRSSSLRSKERDLVRLEAVRALYRDTQPTVLHLAPSVNGIGGSRANPGKFFYDDLRMDVQLIDLAREVGQKKLVALGTACAHPKHCPVPFKTRRWARFSRT